MPPTTRSKNQPRNGHGSLDRTGAGSKHKASTDEPEQDKKTTKKQKTIEETVKNGKKNKSKDRNKSKSEKTEELEAGEQDHKSKTESKSKSKTKGQGKEKGQKDGSKSSSKPEPKSSQGEGKSSSAILEKGIIYFFMRGRVNTDTPSSVNEIARTFILLRPSDSASDKPTHLQNNISRILAVPKKTFPTSGRERWISFVEKTGVSFADLKESFLSGDEHETKTRGTQHTPPATPVGEGVYAITTTGRESHLCYILTIPEELGEVQTKMGLKDKGSFVISTRNPEYPPPGNARLPQGPEFPEEIKKEFNSRRWAPSNPKHLDVQGAQILLVGESSGIEKATEPPKDKDEGEADPLDELEELEEADEERMEDLSKDDSESIFADLRASAEDYPKLQTTF